MRNRPNGVTNVLLVALSLASAVSCDTGGGGVGAGEGADTPSRGGSQTLGDASTGGGELPVGGSVAGGSGGSGGEERPSQGGSDSGGASGGAPDGDTGGRPVGGEVDGGQPVPCDAGQVQTEPCVEGGVRQRACVDGAFSPFGPCEPAPCEPGAPGCGPPPREICNDVDDDGDGEVDEGLLGGGAPPPADAFSLQTAAAVERGLDALRFAEVEGHFEEEHAPGSHNFLIALAFLEQRRDGVGPPVGYAGLSPDDQSRVERILRTTVENNPALFDPNSGQETYRTGGDLMALAAFARTGGPDEIGGPVPVSVALSNGMVALMRGHEQPVGWEYSGPGSDLSTTHFAMNGLSAAAAAMDLPSPVLGFEAGVLSNRTGEGAFSYSPGGGPSTSMTSVGVFALTLAGVDPQDPSIQDGLAWLQATHQPGGFAGDFIEQSTWYAMWGATKALSRTEGLDSPRFRGRDPIADGFPDTAPGLWYDHASTLLAWQGADGWWTPSQPTPDGSIAPGGWSRMSSHAYALLTLERSLGGLPSDDVGVVLAPACADLVDNDLDGVADDADPDCHLPCGTSERPRAECANLVDDDGDGLIDFAQDPGCGGRDDDDERDSACRNGADDDGDGLVDFPMEPGCTSPADADERDPEPAPACANGLDDDDDGQTDYPADVDCAAAAQPGEGEPFACPAGEAVLDLVPGGDPILGRTGAGANAREGECEGRGPELVYRVVVDQPARVTFDTVNDGTNFDSVLAVRAG